jgi:hypothetical protein
MQLVFLTRLLGFKRGFMKIIKICTICLVLFTSGCGIRFKETNIVNLKIKWGNAVNNTAISWWYLGEEDDCYFVIEENFLKRNGYKVKKSDVSIAIENPHELTFDQSLWINLKKGMLRNIDDGIEW